MKFNEPIAAARTIKAYLTDMSGVPLPSSHVFSVGDLTIEQPDGTVHNAVNLPTPRAGATSGAFNIVLAQSELQQLGVIRLEINASGVAYWSFADDVVSDALFYDFAAGGAAGTVTLPAAASATDNYYAGNGHNCVARIVSGTGAGQARLGTAYAGSTKVLTVAPNWSIAPDDTSVVELLPFHAQLDASVLVAAAVQVWGLSRTGNQTAGTFGEYIDAKVSDAVRQIQAATPLAVPTGALLDIVQGDLEVPLSITLVDLTGTPVNVSDATGPLVLHWQKPDGTIVDVDLTNVALNLGQVKYTFAAGDTSLVGGHKAQVVVPRAGGQQTFPMNGTYFRWTVHAKL